MAYRRDHHQGNIGVRRTVGGTVVVATSRAWAGEGSIRVTSVEVILKQTPAGRRPTAKGAGSSGREIASFQVIEMSPIKLHTTIRRTIV